MHIDDCYQLGYIIKPHGLKGEVQVFLDVNEPQSYRKLESVFVLQGQQLVPFFIESISIRSEKAIVAFEDIHSVEAATAIKGSKLYLPLNLLPELKEDEFYLHELVGYQLLDQTSLALGEISDVIDMGPQLTLVVKHTSGRELLIPYNEELKIELNKADRSLTLKIADGLVDLYLEDNED